MESYQMAIDLGGTSGRWIAFNSKNTIKHLTAGFNPFQNSWKNFELMAEEVSLKIKVNLSKIELFGAGFINDVQKDEAANILRKFFSTESINIHSDIILVARATPESLKKVVIILGTGYNSLLCFDNELTQKAPPLGFILGDDGSGAYFGRELLRAYFYKKLDKELTERLEKFQNTDRSVILEHVYSSKQPAGYLASYFPFLIQNKSHTQIYDLLMKGLTDHYTNILSLYPKDAMFYYSGSVAWHLRKELEGIFKENDLYLGKIMKEPLWEFIKSIQQK